MLRFPRSFKWKCPRTGGYELVVPEYSLIICDAWKVVEKLRSMAFLATIRRMPEGWFVKVAPNQIYRIVGQAHGATAPEAICRAAVIALDSQKEPS